MPAEQLHFIMPCSLKNVIHFLYIFHKGARSNSKIPKIAIVITDGHSTHKDKTIEHAEKLKEQGVEIYSIGVGDKVDEDELVKMASNKNLFRVNTFTALSHIQPLLLRQVCTGVLE
jgi:collagen type VI alpha